MYTTRELFDLTHTQAKDYLQKFENPWEALAGIKTFVQELGKRLPKAEYTEISMGVWVHKSATIAPTASINPPCIIGENTEVRHCAFIKARVKTFLFLFVISKNRTK